MTEFFTAVVYKLVVNYVNMRAKEWYKIIQGPLFKAKVSASFLEHILGGIYFPVPGFNIKRINVTFKVHQF